MSTNDESNVPNHQPAFTKPIPAKKPVERSPQLSNSELSQEAYIGLRASSRRIAVVKSIDILLRHNADQVDRFEAEVERCKADIEKHKSNSAA